MSKRNRREHGRILSVETKNRGDSLADDFAAGVTSITVNDAGDFDEDGGWLYIGAQVVEYAECDDDTGVITLADPLAAAAEQGDPVSLWSDLYGEVVDYQLALVELDGEYDNPDPVTAEVAEGVSDLPEGDRGKGGESCVLKRVGEDEWEIVGVGGPRKSQRDRWEQDDFYALTINDVTAASATVPLSHRPNNEALTCVLAGAPQQPTEWAIDYDAQTLTIPLDGWEQAGDVAWVHYAYRRGLTAQRSVSAFTTGVDNPVVPPASAPAGSLLLLAITLPSGHGGATNLNGYTLIGQTDLVSHTVGNSGGGISPAITYRMAVYTRLAPGGAIPVPVFAAHTFDTVYVFAALPQAGAVTASSFGTFAEAGSAATPTLSGANIHLWATLGEYVSISAAGIEAEFNNDPQINICIAPVTDDSRTATVGTTAAWMVASLKTAGA